MQAPDARGRSISADDGTQELTTGASAILIGMSSGQSTDDARARREFVADPVVLAELELRLEDLADEDMRALVIRHEHPEFEEPLKAGVDEIDGPDGPMNPRLHLAMHEIVATQLWDNEPPEVWETATRLLEAGYERHEILHMLGRPAVEQVWATLHEGRPYDRGEHVAALQALPRSWERRRGAMRLEREHAADRGHEKAAGRKQARRQVKASRRANRRRG